jgi:hypothetical protein
LSKLHPLSLLPRSERALRRSELGVDGRPGAVLSVAGEVSIDIERGLRRSAQGWMTFYFTDAPERIRTLAK